MQTRRITRCTIGTLLLFLGGGLAGCELLGGGLASLPFARIVAVQDFESPNYTVIFTVEDSVNDSSLVDHINWVFGDGSGFVQGPSGRSSITYRYEATGTFEVTAFVFDTSGLATQIDGAVTVRANGDEPPEPAPAPGGISGPNPEDGAEAVPVDSTLTWTGSGEALSYGVYLLAEDRAAVEEADDASAGVFQGNQTETEFTPSVLEPDTQYFWRIDEFNDRGLTKSEVLGFTTAAAPEEAEDLLPVHGVTTAPVRQVLEWTAGQGAESHDVFFGTDEELVTNATTETDDVFKGNQTGTSYDPEDEGSEVDGELLAATTYFWRIDEVGPGGRTEGLVLWFRTAPAPAQIHDANPVDDATGVDVNQNFSWSAVPSIESFDIYLGVDPAAVGAARRSSPGFEGNQTTMAFDPGTLIGQADYYWRADSLGPGGTTKGDVLHFTTAGPPPQAAGIAPADDASNVSIEALLEWDPDTSGATASFDVYLSTDEAAALGGLPEALEGNQLVTGSAPESFDPGDLDPDTLYFWRIDAVGPGGTTSGLVRRFRTAARPDQAEGPDPAQEATGVALDVTLRWDPVGNADSYEVYLGDNQSDVQNAEPSNAEFKGSQPASDPEEFVPDELDGNRRYFWRIDTVSAGGTTAGEVWQFVTRAGKATDPGPTDGETGVVIEVELSWTAGRGASSHDVYLGTDPNELDPTTDDPPEIFRGNQSGTTFTPDDLVGGQDYYWRVDQVRSDGTTSGDVWHFTTGAAPAGGPIWPADGELGVALVPAITWTAGAGAASHDVYFGVDQSAVQNATDTSVEFQGNQSGAAFTPGGVLEPGTAYYWRIDELDGDDNVTTGEVWQFTTGPAPAAGPTPADGETGVLLDVVLGWTAGSGAVSHDVYFGSVEAEVISGSAFEGNQSGTGFDPGGLDGGTTYFWRIDEVGEPGHGTSTGEVWQFTTVAEQAGGPIFPADGESGVPLLPAMIWTAGGGAVAHDVYLGAVMNDVLNATRTSAEFQGNQSAATFTPNESLEPRTTYYWRIDEVDQHENVTVGAVWQFVTTGADPATSPSPANAATDVPLEVVLSWTAGAETESHDIYLGTDLQIVATSGVPDVASWPVSIIDPAVIPVTITADTTYFWRVDEVDVDGNRTRGEVWWFRTEP